MKHVNTSRLYNADADEETMKNTHLLRVPRHHLFFITASFRVLNMASSSSSFSSFCT
jgi:hypothetical protein